VNEGASARLVAWHLELRAAHQRLRSALEVAQAAAIDAAAGRPTGDPAELGSDLLLFCHGFCLALTGHHVGEDARLFPELARLHPELRPTIAKLEQDHSMIGYLLGALDDAVTSGATPAALARHLEGIAAIMESHFGFEERQLLPLLAELELDADPAAVFGPL
jgi:hemerythrin-like domain-containing protein